MNTKFHGLRTRLLTGIAAAIVALGLTFAHPYSFAALLVAGCGIGIREWETLNLHKTIGFRLFGFVYLLASICALAWLRVYPFGGETGPEWIIGLFAMVWGTDTAAYISGRLIGGPKIAPSISPNKTWAGLIGGILASAAIAFYLSHYIPSLNAIVACFAGAGIALIAQAGDFFESALKRRAGVKNSGTLLPGHGGLLDRIDGLMPASLLYACFIWSITHS